MKENIKSKIKLKEETNEIRGKKMKNLKNIWWKIKIKWKFKKERKKRKEENC